eukprot:9496598-Pyramimonas_sp.AAC.2
MAILCAPRGGGQPGAADPGRGRRARRPRQPGGAESEGARLLPRGGDQNETRPPRQRLHRGGPQLVVRGGVLISSREDGWVVTCEAQLPPHGTTAAEACGPAVVGGM